MKVIWGMANRRRHRMAAPALAEGKQSLDYCIETWDPGHKGVVEEPHHNTYDIEFWGADGMCTSFYLGALQAAAKMSQALADPTPLYDELAKGTTKAENELFDGEYFIQKIEWKNLRAKIPLEVQSFGGAYSPEAIALMSKEGPKYQYGTGCLSDGVLGSWLALVCGVGQVLDRAKVASHLKAIHTHNLKKDLSDYPNPQRPSYACGAEGGLLLCTWPKGGNCRSRSSTPTKSGPASSTRLRRPDAHGLGARRA